MNTEEIRKKYQSAIDEELSRAGAKLEPEFAETLAQFVTMAARSLAEVEEYEQDFHLGRGIAEYKKLAGKLIEAAKTFGSLPNIHKHAWDLAFMQLGDNPPYWYR